MHSSSSGSTKSRLFQDSCRGPRLIAYFAFGVLFLKLLSGCAVTRQPAVPLRTVRIAANLPLSGPLAIYGQTIKDGAAMAIDDLRQVGSKDARFQVDWHDNTGSPKTTLSVYQRQIMDLPDIYWSGVKPQTMAINDQLRRAEIPHFVWTFDPFINKESKEAHLPANNFRTWVNFKIEAPALINYVAEKKAKRVAIIYVKLPNSQEEFDGIVIPALKAMKIQDILVDTYDAGTKDYAALAVKVRDFKPDVIILNGFQDNFVGLTRAFRPLGLIHHGNTICSFDLLDASRVLGKDELEGLRVVTPMFADHRDNAEIKGWSTRFYQRTGLWPLYTSAYSYDAIMIINEAAKKLALPAKSEQWLKALKATKMRGVTGPLSFDEDGSLNTPVEVAVFKDGVLKPAPIASSPD
jgi:branched-chain amino acid transport system substrate-binding protein